MQQPKYVLVSGPGIIPFRKPPTRFAAEIRPRDGVKDRSFLGGTPPRAMDQKRGTVHYCSGGPEAWHGPFTRGWTMSVARSILSSGVHPPPMIDQKNNLNQFWCPFPKQNKASLSSAETCVQRPQPKYVQRRNLSMFLPLGPPKGPRARTLKNNHGPREKHVL